MGTCLQGLGFVGVVSGVVSVCSQICVNFGFLVFLVFGVGFLMIGVSWYDGCEFL